MRLHRFALLFLPLAAAILLWSAGSSDAAVPASDRARLSKLFPADGALGGWHKRAPIAYYDKDTLYNYIDGQADAFFVFDFRACAAADYVTGSGRKASVTVDVYDMGQDKDAFGMYASERYGAKEVPIGTQGYVEPDHVNFWKGRYYVKVSGIGLGGGAKQTLTAFAQQVAARISAPAKMPAVLKALPSGWIKGTEKYARRNLFGQSFLNDGVLADYTVGRARATLFVIKHPSSQTAARAMAQFRSYEQRSAGAKPVAGLGDEAFTAKDRYLKTLVIARRGVVVAGVSGEVAPQQVAGLLKRALAGR